MAEEVEKRIIRMEMNNLTLGDMMDFEELTGEPMSALRDYSRKAQRARAAAVAEAEARGEDPDPNVEIGIPMKLMVAMIYISERRTDPRLTFEDVRNFDMASLELEVVDQEDTPFDEESSDA